MSVQTFQVGVKALIRNKEGKILLVRIPEWSGNQAHWDMPGGRMDIGETFEQTLRREIKEEINVDYKSETEHLSTFLTSITIPVGSKRLPLIYVVFKVDLPEDAKVELDPDSAEEAFEYFLPQQAAKELAYKCSEKFCKIVAGL